MPKVPNSPAAKGGADVWASKALCKAYWLCRQSVWLVWLRRNALRLCRLCAVQALPALGMGGGFDRVLRCNANRLKRGFGRMHLRCNVPPRVWVRTRGSCVGMERGHASGCAGYARGGYHVKHFALNLEGTFANLGGKLFVKRFPPKPPFKNISVYLLAQAVSNSSFRSRWSL